MPLAAALLLVVMTPQDAPSAPKQEAAPAAEATAAAPSAIAAGQAAFKKRRFKAAQADFEKALAADPQSAAAAFYLGYTHYKMGEPRPSRSTRPSRPTGDAGRRLRRPSRSGERACYCSRRWTKDILLMSE
jgi:tetratricopeptide (TPR) repeat protein